MGHPVHVKFGAHQRCAHEKRCTDGNDSIFQRIASGSGIGGLCTGALLADKGYRVAVVERLSTPGGRCSTRMKKGYRLDLGVQMLLTNPLEDICKQVGVTLDRTMLVGTVEPTAVAVDRAPRPREVGQVVVGAEDIDARFWSHHGPG